jgi:hypothetical protein
MGSNTWHISANGAAQKQASQLVKPIFSFSLFFFFFFSFLWGTGYMILSQKHVIVDVYINMCFLNGIKSAYNIRTALVLCLRA